MPASVMPPPREGWNTLWTEETVRDTQGQDILALVRLSMALSALPHTLPEHSGHCCLLPKGSQEDTVFLCPCWHFSASGFFVGRQWLAMLCLRKKERTFVSPRRHCVTYMVFRENLGMFHPVKSGFETGQLPRKTNVAPTEVPCLARASLWISRGKRVWKITKPQAPFTLVHLLGHVVSSLCSVFAHWPVYPNVDHLICHLFCPPPRPGNKEKRPKVTKVMY
jgi:hypothetical protein